jgi:hypothetical protein
MTGISNDGFIEPFHMLKENSDMEQSVIHTEKVVDRVLILVLLYCRLWSWRYFTQI